MTLSDTLSILGIVISALFGIWGIYLAVRRAKYPASLTFVREQSVAILEDFARKIPNLTVLYRDVPVDKSVVLLSGYVVNDGALDISREMTEKPLLCVLPEGCSWLEFKVTTSAPALHVDSALLDAQSAKLEFGLFRRDESFSFQSLALLGGINAKLKASDFAEKVSWKHRIASLGEIKTVQMPPPPKSSKRALWARRAFFAVIGGIYMFIGISQITGLGPLGRQPSIVHTVERDGKKATVKLIPNSDGTTTVRNVETGEGIEVDLDSYSKLATFAPSYSTKRENSWVSISLGVFILLASFAIIFTGFANEYRRHKLRKLVAASAEET